MRTDYKVGWWVAATLVACGGQVEDEDPEGQAGAPQQQEAQPSGSGTGNGAGSGGPTCAGTKPHPDYPLCYETQYPPCLTTSSPKLPEKLSVQPGSISRGPWIGASSQCRMLCCYAP
jgi:hypothetical protein